jgi:hypothetical protein
MAHPFYEDIRLNFNHKGLMKQIRNCMESLPDSRMGSNTQYEMR